MLSGCKHKEIGTVTLLYMPLGGHLSKEMILINERHKKASAEIQMLAVLTNVQQKAGQ
jgi:hypothetical protein